MPEICPKIAQDISKICLRYAQALPKVWGFILRKWDKMSLGRVYQLGQYVSGEVHNAVGQFVLGTKCLLTFALHLVWIHAGCKTMTMVVKPDLRQQLDPKILNSTSEVTLPKLQAWFLLNSNSAFGEKGVL